MAERTDCLICYMVWLVALITYKTLSEGVAIVQPRLQTSSYGGHFMIITKVLNYRGFLFLVFCLLII